MSKNNKKLSLGDCYLYGRFGFSLNLDIVNNLAKSVYNYCTKNKIDTILLGHDVDDTSKIVIIEMLIPALINLGISCQYINSNITNFQLSWTINQQNRRKKILGIYAYINWYFSDTILLSFKDTYGYTLSTQELQSLYRSTKNIKTYEVSQFINQPKPEELNINLYVNYLKDTKIINTNIKENIVVDVMFGSSLSIITNLNKICSSLNINILNKSIPTLKLKNYSAIPTGNVLITSAKQAHDITSTSLFSIDSSGECLGVYDLKNKEEISPGSALMILMFLYHKKAMTGNILITKAVSDKVSFLGKKLGFKIKKINSGIDAFTKEIRKRDYIFFGDELGRYWFKEDTTYYNPVVAMCKIIECCNLTNMSTADLVNHISKLFLRKNYVYCNLIFPKDELTKDTLTEDLVKFYENNNKIKKIGNSKTSLIYLKDNVKISLYEIAVENSIRVFLEANNMSLLETAAKEIESIYTQGIDNEVTKNRIKQSTANLFN